MAFNQVLDRRDFQWLLFEGRGQLEATSNVGPMGIVTQSLEAVQSAQSHAAAKGFKVTGQITMSQIPQGPTLGGTYKNVFSGAMRISRS